MSSFLRQHQNAHCPGHRYAERICDAGGSTFIEDQPTGVKGQRKLDRLAFTRAKLCVDEFLTNRPEKGLLNDPFEPGDASRGLLSDCWWDRDASEQVAKDLQTADLR